LDSFDGKKLDPVYEAPAFSGPEPSAVDDGKLYTGSCHCGAVTFAINVEPIETAADCNCSICQRVCFLVNLVSAVAILTLVSRLVLAGSLPPLPR
jgi:hypothetical protein